MQKLVLRLTYGIFVRNILRMIVGVHFDNSKFLLQEKQFIIVANHNSHLDTMALMASLPGTIIHKVKPVAAMDYFGKTKMMAMLSNYFINTLLIERKSERTPENDPIKKMVDALDEGYSLILFPEGTRGEPEKMQAFKKGVARILSQRPTVKYVPAYLKGLGKTWPKGERVIVPYNSYLRFGKPTLINTQDVDEILVQVERDVLELKEKS